MPFYRGDYYRGDYYRGDPFLGGLIAGAAKKILPKVGKWVGQAAGLVSPSRRSTVRSIQNVTRDLLVGTTGYAMGRAAGPEDPEVYDPGMIPQAVSMPGGAVVVVEGKGPTPKNKKNYGSGKFRRTMNPLNPKALRRALRRAEGFEKFAKRTMNALYTGSRRTFKKKTPRS